MKALVALIGLGAICASFGMAQALNLKVILALVTSGALGLAIGDLFLFSAYASMGSARTILLYSFQPLFMGLAGYFLFSQAVDGRQLLAIVFLILCLATMAVEKRQQSGHWQWRGLIAALLGVLLDNCGALLTRWSFNSVPDLHPLWANFFRCLGAVSFFLVYQWYRPFGWWGNFARSSPVNRWQVIGASLVGTLLSLYFYLAALKIGHLATIGALGVVAPVLAAVFECTVERKWPSRSHLLAFAWLAAGLSVLLI